MFIVLLLHINNVARKLVDLCEIRGEAIFLEEDVVDLH